VVPSSTSSSGSYPCLGAGGSGPFAADGLGLEGFGAGLGAVDACLGARGVGLEAVGVGFEAVGDSLEVVCAGLDFACPTRTRGAAVFSGLARVVLDLPGFAAATLVLAAFSPVVFVGVAFSPAALSRVAALRALARWGRVRGSAARIPPSGIESGWPLGFSRLLICSQSSRTGSRRAKHSVSHPFCV
jgi:hypothetical protein